MQAHLCPEVSGAEKTSKRVPDENKLMRRHNETLPSGNKDPRRLVPLHATEQGVDGVSQAGEVRQALGRVEGQQLGVLERQREGKRRRGAQLQRKKEAIIIYSRLV